MATTTLDLPPVIAAARALATQCQNIIIGCQDLLNPGLTSTEQAPLLSLIDQYTVFRDYYTRLADQAQLLIDAGHPPLPSTSIPQTLRDKLAAAIQAEQAALALLTGVPDATSGKLQFSPAVEKPA